MSKLRKPRRGEVIDPSVLRHKRQIEHVLKKLVQADEELGKVVESLSILAKECKPVMWHVVFRHTLEGMVSEVVANNYKALRANIKNVITMIEWARLNGG